MNQDKLLKSRFQMGGLRPKSFGRYQPNSLISKLERKTFMELRRMKRPGYGGRTLMGSLALVIMSHETVSIPWSHWRIITSKTFSLVKIIVVAQLMIQS